MNIHPKILSTMVIGLIIGWLIVVATGVMGFRAGSPHTLSEIMVYSLILPILLSAFFFGRNGGLLVALIGSMIAASLVVRQPASLQSPFIQRILFQIIFFNVVALTTSTLSEREKQTTTLYRDLFNSVPLGLYRASIDNYQLFTVNDTLATMLKYTTADALQGVSLVDLYPKDAALTAKMSQLQQEHVLHLVECEVRCADGSVIWVKETLRLVFPLDDDPYLEGSMRDITVEKQLEDQLRQAQKLDAVGRLAGGVAHDFNNLLTAIIGFAEMLRLRLPAYGPEPVMLQNIITASNRAAELVGQLLAFSRKQIIKPVLLQLNDIVPEVLSIARGVIGETIQVKTILQADLNHVYADRTQIDQILMNLLINAADAISETGSITIQTRNVQLFETDLAGFTDLVSGNYVELSVTDTGHGMPPDVQAKIFEPFFTTKGVGEGTGLGLSTVFGIVKQNGGDIQVQSEVDQGTTFSILLPGLEPESNQPQLEEDSPPATRQRQGGAVLVVSEDAAVRQLNTFVLRQEGYHVLEAENGRSALHLANFYDKPIDVLVADVTIPKLDGLESAGQLQAIYPNLKFIFISDADPRALSETAWPVPNLFLSKPCTPAALLGGVAELLKPPG